jgi:hypothetical protein
MNRFFKETLPHFLARNLPKRVKFWAFIHVHALEGCAPGSYKQAYDYCVKKWNLK